MKCKVCQKRIPKKQEICPNCGTRIDNQVSASKYNTVSNILKPFGVGLVLFFFLMFGMLISPGGWRLFGEDLLTGGDYMTGHSDYMDAYFSQYDGLTFDEAIQAGYKEDMTLVHTNDYKTGLVDVIKELGYENIVIKEECERIYEYSLLLKAVMLIEADKNDIHYTIKVTYQNEELLQAYMLGSGSSLSTNKDFELKQADIKPILDYLKINDGYTLLSDGYKKIEKVEDNKYSYYKTDTYTVSLVKDIYNKIYRFTYSIGY